ncbi:unnamed protein product [Peronospora belbahrii]|nr:unnamed protein product [Peronospora belbahrii]
MDRYSLTCSTPFPVAPDASAVDTWQFSSVCEQDRQVLRVSSSALTSDKQSRTGEAVESFEEQKLFQLQPVEWNQHQQEEEQAEKEALMIRTRQPSVLNPLRPGKYEFIGFTTSDTPSVIPAVVPRRTNGCRDRPRPVMTTTKNKCLVTLRLLPDGTLRGTSREVVQPQVCQLHGRWSAKRVVYTMEYRVREAVGHFRYSGAVVIDKGGAGVSNGKKMKCKSKANACGKRCEMLSGKWRNEDQDHADGYEGGRGEFKLELVRVDFTSIAIKTDQIEYGILPVFQQKQQQQINQDTGAAIDVDDNDDAIHAFTSGEYELSGCATDADGYEYAFDLEMQLHPGGKLIGWSKERIFQQTCPVFGRWEPSRIVYSQQYMVQHEVGMYTYSADMSTNDAVIRGTWANAEVDCALAPSEHGTFALILVKSTRRWSTFSHSYYPLKFRQRVLTILMASARRHEIPGVIWTNVFAFCNETWFT